ncbi:MAG TPA: FAD:protein FMN transferase [Solirubrobacteraceae bacterium]|nr:FAD:protein FMN transferase [Solirubrobacteraceae bacterium]
MEPVVIATPEAGETFSCFGSTCAVFVIGAGALGSAAQAVGVARERLLDWHTRFSRFDPRSELCALNSDARATVPVSLEMARLAAAAVSAAQTSGGLVDATMVDEIGASGYAGELHPGPTLAAALDLAPRRRPAGPRTTSRWREIRPDFEALTLTRPPGCKLDSGGIAKGLFADLLAELLADHAAYAIDCAGDLRLGGTEGIRRHVVVASPFDERTLHEYELAGGGVATSGIGRRSWLDAAGRPGHHLLDPASGRPAYTGVVQVTALAPTALRAEVRAKAALLSGPDHAEDWLPDGGVVVHDDGRAVILDPSRAVR